MSLIPEAASAVKPSAAELMTVNAEAKAREIFEKMIDRARRAARFDVEGSTHHDASTLFSFAGNVTLMFALHEFYTATQQEIRELDHRGR